MALITYEQACRHLKIDSTVSSPPSDQQLDIELKMDQATAFVLNHIKRLDALWSTDSSPSEDPEFAIVQAAVLKVLKNLDRFRGDDAPDSGPLTDEIVNMLSMLRDPSLA